MKANQSISRLLGLKQEQMAMLLQIPRSRFSLYELKLRPIPADSVEILAELTFISQTIDVEAHKEPSATEIEHYINTVEKSLRENAYQQRLLFNKISALEKKQHSGLMVPHLAKGYNDDDGKKAAYQKGMLKSFADDALKSVGIYPWSQLRQYEIKIKTLQQEEKILREELEGFGK